MIRKTLFGACLAFGIVVAEASATAGDSQSVDPIVIPVVSGTDDFGAVLKGICEESFRAKGDTETLANVYKSVCGNVKNGSKLAESEWNSLREWAKSPKTRTDLGILMGGAFQGPTSAVDPFSSVESALLNGLAKLVVTRAKAEAALYLRDHVADRLCGETPEKLLPAVRFFPETCTALRDTDPEISLYAMGATLRFAARTDLEELPDRVLVSAEEQSPAKMAEFETMRLSYATLLAAARGRSPVDLMRSLHEVKLSRCEGDSQCKVAFAAIRTASAAFDATERMGLRKEVDVYHAAAFAVVLEERLLAARVRDEKKILSPDLMESLRALPPTTVRLLNSVVALAKRRGLGEEEKDAGARRKELAIASAEAVESLTRLAETLPNLKELGVQNDEKTLEAIRAVRTVVRLGRAVIEEDYAAASSQAVALLVKYRGDCIEGGSPPDTAQCKLVRGAVRTLPLVAEVGSAQSSEDVAATLEAAVDPLGSYRAKYQRDTITLGAMLGFAAGWEGLPRQDVTGSTSGTFGVFAPVGFHLAWPYEAEGAKYHGGFFVSVLDLGALASYRIDNELKPTNETKTAEAATEPNVSFEQVFSPGVYGVLGFCGSPFVFGGGISAAPALRDVTFVDSVGGATTTSESAALRYQFFVAVDVPLIGF